LGTGGKDAHFAVLAAVLRDAPNQFVFSERAFGSVSCAPPDPSGSRA